MIPVEIVQESGEGGWRRAVEVVNACMIYLIHCKNLWKCYKAPTPSTIIIRKEKNSNKPVTKFFLKGSFVGTLKNNHSYLKENHYFKRY
jgi:hypothetical protein